MKPSTVIVMCRISLRALTLRFPAASGDRSRRYGRLVADWVDGGYRRLVAG